MATLSLNICNIQPQSPEHLQGKVLPACAKAIPAHATGKFSTDQLSSITTPKHNVTQASSGGEVASRTSTTILEDSVGVLQDFQPRPAAEQERSLVEHAVKPMLAHILRFLVDEIHKTEVDEVPGHVSDASNRIRQQFQSTLETLLSREATPYVIEHRDFSNRLLVQVFKADEVVNIASAARFARWAVTMPLSTGFIRKGHQCNLVGSLHGVICFEKNHGTSPTLPYISVIEVVPLGGMEYPIILLVDTFLVNAHFTREKTPNLIYKAMRDGWRYIYIPGPATCSTNSGEDEGHNDRESIPEDHEQQINLDRIQVWAEAVRFQDARNDENFEKSRSRSRRRGSINSRKNDIHIRGFKLRSAAHWRWAQGRAKMGLSGEHQGSAGVSPAYDLPKKTQVKPPN
ncbi:hypothetical protein C8J57DRAFT_1249555 [Mycena rebaudengoi]|nr:hypothetical protein C8J57DRAFT_1249555 [Mycena rebaudengoi]